MFVYLGINFFVLCVKILPCLASRTLLAFCLIKLSLYHLQLIFFTLFVLFFLLDSLLLRLLPHLQLLIILPQILLLILIGLNFRFDLLQLTPIRLHTYLQNLLLLLELLISNGKLMNRCDLALSDRIILFHEHMQLLHLRLEPLYLLLGELLMLP